MPKLRYSEDELLKRTKLNGEGVQGGKEGAGGKFTACGAICGLLHFQ